MSWSTSEVPEPTETANPVVWSGKSSSPLRAYTITKPFYYVLTFKDYDGVIILDECHRAKNLVPTTGAKPTKTGRMVLELQKALPNARVVYASATGATGWFFLGHFKYSFI